MDAKTVVDLGFDTCGGQIDYCGKNYGFLAPGGEAVLTEEGRELAAALASRQIMAATPPVTEKRRGRPSKVAEETKELVGEEALLSALTDD